MADRVKIEQALELCRQLPVIRNQLFEAGLFKSGHAMQAACEAIGYETAEAIQSQNPATKP